jgi:hypothetical protein
MSLLACRMFTASWCLLHKTDENPSFLLYLNETGAPIQHNYSRWSKCQHNILYTLVLGFNRKILIINKILVHIKNKIEFLKLAPKKSYI